MRGGDAPGFEGTVTDGIRFDRTPGDTQRKSVVETRWKQRTRRRPAPASSPANQATHRGLRTTWCRTRRRVTRAGLPPALPKDRRALS